VAGVVPRRRPGSAGPVDRLAAIRLLARSGEVPAQVADQVAAALDDDDPELRAWAAATLAHRGDARAVAPLTELLTQPECPWPGGWTASSAPPQRLLDMLGPHADAHAPAVTYRLTQPGTGGWHHVSRDLLDGLATWVDQAAGTAAALTGLLARQGEGRHAIATVLGRIGPAAAVSVPVLDELLAEAAAEPAGVLAWARWRITGERTAQTAQTLALMAGIPRHGPEGLRLLADLGSAAAPHVPVIVLPQPPSTGSARQIPRPGPSRRLKVTRTDLPPSARPQSPIPGCDFHGQFHWCSRCGWALRNDRTRRRRGIGICGLGDGQPRLLPQGRQVAG
jgi:hypothetical protein